MGAVQPSKKWRIIIDSDSEEDYTRAFMYTHVCKKGNNLSLLDYPRNCFLY